MATIGKVRAVFTASTGGLTSGVNAAASSMKRMEASVASLRGSMSSLVSINAAQLFGSIASSAASAVGSLVRFGQSQAQVIDDTSKLAARLGMTYGELAGIGLAGELAGVGMETIGAAATKADVAFVRAAEGSAQAQAAFAGLGLSVEQLNGMTAAQRFEAIAQAISELPTEAQRAEAAVQIFGRSGAELLPLFAGGAEGIRAAREEADRFGLSLTNMQGQQVEAMNDAFTRAYSAIQGVVQQVVAYLAPGIEAVTTAFSDFIGNVGGKNIGQSIGEGILQGARYLAQVADAIIPTFKAVFEYFSKVGGQWSVVYSAGQRVADFFLGVGRTLESVFKGGASVLASVLGRWSVTIGQLAQKIPGLGDFGAQANAAGQSLMRSAERLWSEAGTALGQAGENFGNAVFGRKPEEAGQAMAGPVTAAVDQMIAAAQAAAAQVDQSTAQSLDVAKKIAEQPQKIEVAISKEAIKGIDSRSAEGVREMFRIMRGEGGNSPAERTARATERTNDILGNLDFSEDVMDIAAAAGA